MIEQVDIKKIKSNPNNPRVIKDDKFQQLVKSVIEFPEMLQLRPIVVNDDMIVLGGNMRLKACIDAGLKQVPIINAKNLSEEKQREFIIKDNIGFGEWDWAMLTTEWDTNELNDWGLEVQKFNEVNIDEFFDEEIKSKEDGKYKIVLNYTLEEYELVKEELFKHGKTPEQAIYKLLGL